MAAFMVDETKVHVTGLPRYDLLKKDYPLDNFLQMQKEKLLTLKKDKRLILYAPTFREKNISALEQISNIDWDKLSTVLKEHNTVMGIRPHAYDKALPSYIADNENFFLLPHKVFTETNLILQLTDLLLVDFSSIWIDYLLLNRPIIGFAKDFSHYIDAERGFVYDFKKTFPDDFCISIDTLVQHIETLLIQKIQKIEYKTATSLFHTYPLETNFMLNLKNTLILSG
jgi:CDP-glycerol glycerophosphotransferase (TagB/SpsB family)